MLSKVYFVLFVRGSKICGSFGLVTAPPQQKFADKKGKQNYKYDGDYISKL